MATEFSMALTTTLGSELLFQRMNATEELGRLFEFNIEALADSGTIRPEELLGKTASVALDLPDGAFRYFHGIVCAMGTDGTSRRRFRYRMVLRPWLWLLTRRTDTRVFQEMSVQDILKKVFEPFSADYEVNLTGSFPKYEYCVQYRETDFDFVSRLMEQEGIYYYFRHVSNKHTMVIVNAPSAHAEYPQQGTFRFRDKVDPQHDFEPITQWRADTEIQSGQVVLRDFDFVQPGASLETKAKATRADAPAKLEVYDYPGPYPTKAEGDRYSQLRIEELQARYSRATGFGAIRRLACGYRFTLEEHPRADQNRAHLVVATRIEMAHGGYETGLETTFCHCNFVALEGSETFRPQRTTPRPVVRGLHSAIVVGPSGEELFTDEHGRVKVQFHWDRIGKSDDKSSCWVRVASPWAGQAWGMISLPRIGQEVVVDFLDGNPDRPLITGRVYNGEQTPPYPLPANATVSTNKSRSSKNGDAANFNELRFEDKKGEEYVWLQAEKDFHHLVKNDATLKVVGNQDTLIEKNRTEQMDGDVKVKIGKDFVTEVIGSNSLKVTKDIMVETSATLSQKSGANTDVKVGANLGVDAAANVHIKGGANIVIEAGVMVTLKAGGSSVVVGPSGVMIIGTMVMINSGGAGGSGSGASPKPVLQVVEPVKKDDPLA